MQMQGEIEGSGFSPSFNCYSSDTITSTTIAKVISEQQYVSKFHEAKDVENEDFEFKLLLNDDVAFLNVFNHEFPLNNEVVDHESDTLEKLFNDQPEEYSLEDDELEGLPSGTFCVWQPTKCKKSRSTGSGSKGWIIRYLLRRSNSEGKEPMMLLRSKQKRRSGEVLNVAGRWKVGTPVHERFYVERRAEKEEGKRKSYLPYRKDLVGLSFASVIGMGKMLPF